MKPPSQFEKMRNNQTKLQEVRRVAAREAFLQALDDLRPNGKWVYSVGRPAPEAQSNGPNQCTGYFGDVGA